MERLRDLTEKMKADASWHTPGRFLMALAHGKGDTHAALIFAESQRHWVDQRQIVPAIRAAVVTGDGTGTFDPAQQPVADAFLSAMRDFSIPMRLALRRVPALTRLYVNAQGVVAATVAEGAPIPVLRGNWAAITLTLLKRAGIVVLTDELVDSATPTASAALTSDLAEAVAESENRAFISPDESGSVFDGAPSFAGTGSTITAIDADLLALVDLVPGAFRPGAAFAMTKQTATFLSLVRGSGGCRAYPDITPQGGFLQGLPVLVTSACEQTGSPPTRIIGLISPSEIFWADSGNVQLSTSKSAALQMLDDPTNDALAGTATTMVPMFQANATAFKAIRESNWYARAGSGAYFIAGF